MPGMGMGIAKEETYNKYGDSSAKIQIGSIERHGNFNIAGSSGIQGVALIEWRFAYAM